MENNRIRKRFATCVAYLLATAGVLEASIGLCQILGLYTSHNAIYRLTGTFYNPGPYSGFLAVCLPVCMGLYLEKKGQGIATENMCLGAVLLVASMLPAGMSRTAWVAALAGCVLVIASYRCHNWQSLWRRNLWQWSFIAAIFMISIGTLGTFAYHLKKDSADGRLLMWKVAAHAVVEHPLTGVGWDGVAGAYGNAQEEYFRSGRASKQEKRVAGSPEYVFNEYLQIAIAWGIPVTVLLVAVVSCGFWGCVRKGYYGLSGALLALAIFSIASYPFQFPEFVTVLILLVATGLPLFGSGLVLVLGSVICLNLLKRKIQAAEWEQTRYTYVMGYYEDAVKEAKLHYAEWDWNTRFVFEYGHALHKLQLPEESNIVLKQALRVSSDPMILNIIGKNFEELGLPEEAEQWFLRSTYRLPGRIYPYYLLAQLYATHSDRFPPNRLEWAVNRVLAEEPKIESSAVREMRNCARKLLNGYHEKNK